MWDAHLQKLVDEELGRRAAQTVEQDMGLVRGLIGVSAGAIRIMQARFRPALDAIERGEPMPEDAPEVSPNALATLVESTVKLHRLLAGEVTERHEQVSREADEVARAREELERRIEAVAGRLSRAGTME